MERSDLPTADTSRTPPHLHQARAGALPLPAQCLPPTLTSGASGLGVALHRQADAPGGTARAPAGPRGVGQPGDAPPALALYPGAGTPARGGGRVAFAQARPLAGGAGGCGGAKGLVNFLSAYILT